MYLIIKHKLLIYTALLLFLTSGYSQIGIGTVTPEAMLHVKGDTRLEHSSSGSDKILKVNQDGEVRWARPFMLEIIGTTLPVTGLNISEINTPRYTNLSITLPRGRYIVKGIFLLNASNTLTTKEAIWVTCYLSDSSTSSAFTTDVIPLSANQMSGGLIGPAIYNILEGSIAIENNTSAPKTYYLWASKTNHGTSHTRYIVNFGSSNWGENVLYAVPFD